MTNSEPSESNKHDDKENREIWGKVARDTAPSAELLAIELPIAEPQPVLERLDAPKISTISTSFKSAESQIPKEYKEFEEEIEKTTEKPRCPYCNAVLTQSHIDLKKTGMKGICDNCSRMV